MPLTPRDRWARAAAGWEAGADWFRDATMPVSAWMVDAVNPLPGQTILDLAAGTGDTGFLAAELIQPGGELITSDFAPEMLAAAQRRATALGITNVRFRQMDANVPLDQAAASLDAVLCRWGYMLMDDAENALRETRRVLKQHGRLALAAWTAAEENPWSALPLRLLDARGLLAPTSGPGQFAWAAEGEVAERLASAGFVDFAVARVDFSFRYADVDDWWVAQTQRSERMASANERLDFATRSDVLAELERAAEPFLAPDESLVIPAATWVATATV